MSSKDVECAWTTVRNNSIAIPSDVPLWMPTAQEKKATFKHVMTNCPP